MHERLPENGVQAILARELDDKNLLELRRLAAFGDSDSSRLLIQQIDELRAMMQRTGEGMSKDVTSLDIVDIRELTRDVRKTAESFAAEQSRVRMRTSSFGKRGLE